MSKERELLKGAVEWLHELKYAWVEERDWGDRDLLDLVADINKIEQLLNSPEQAPSVKLPESEKEVTWQYRTKANYGDYGWSQWITCGKEFYEHREKTPLRNGFCYEVRKAHGITGVDDE
jgi:hypothetical protein